MAFVRDITDEKRSAAIMQARVRLLEYAATHSLEELLVATVDEAETLTGSGIGLLHFLEADQQTVTVQAWSTRTRREACRTDRSTAMPTSRGRRQGGLRAPAQSGDSQRLRGTPARKGLPNGHTTLIRELVVPVFRGGLIVAMLGVGNKPDAYTDVDVETVTLLADLAWDIAERRRTQESLAPAKSAIACSSKPATKACG